MAKFRKQSIVAGSPAIQEHEEMMNTVLDDTSQQVAVPAGEAAGQLPPTASTASHPGVFSAALAEPMKNVQTRIPLSLYEKLNRMKYFAGQRTSIGDILAQAIQEFADRHPV